MQNIFASYYNINQAIGVHINLLSDNKVLINACDINVNGSQLDIGKRIIDLQKLEELKKDFPVKSYLALDLSGKGILQKRIKKVQKIDQSVFAQLLPNANINDFYVQNFRSGAWSYVSVIRKSE